jgi:hypothetical protein
VYSLNDATVANHFKQRLWHKPLNRNISEAMNFAEAIHHRQTDFARAAGRAVIFWTRPPVEFFQPRDGFLETVIAAQQFPNFRGGITRSRQASKGCADVAAREP